MARGNTIKATTSNGSALGFEATLYLAVGQAAPAAQLVELNSSAPREYYVEDGRGDIAAGLVHEVDADGKQLRVVKLTDYTAEKVRTLCASPDELRARWADVGQRADILQQLAERGIDFATVAAHSRNFPHPASSSCQLNS
jgi:hypothetical protein